MNTMFFFQATTVVSCIRWLCVYLALYSLSPATVEAFVRPATDLVQVLLVSKIKNNLRHHRYSSSTVAAAVQVEGYDDAFRIIDECAVEGEPSEELFDAVRVIDKNALKIYPDDTHKQELWDTAHGSWKLQLATGGGQKTTFKSIPIFAFAMIDDVNFGNGVGFNADTILLSLLGPHIFNTQRRQMTITIDDMFLGSKQVTSFVPAFVKDAMGIEKRPEDFKRAPAFTFIGASDKALIARGGTGGIAIWTRLEKDIRPAAYGKQ